MRLRMNYVTQTDKITNALYNEDICPSCGMRGLEYVDDPDCMASEYTRVFECRSCNDTISFYGAVEWTSFEVEESTLDMSSSYEDTKLESARKNAIKKADDMQTHMLAIQRELEGFIESHSDGYHRDDYGPFLHEDLIDEETFLMALQVLRYRDRETGMLDQQMVKDYNRRKGDFAPGGTKERATSVDRFYEMGPFKDYHKDRARGHAWMPHVMEAHVELAVEMGASMTTELFVQAIWFYIANEGELDENWLEDEERMNLVENHVLPLARFLLERDTEYAYKYLPSYTTKAERVAEYTKDLINIVNNIKHSLEIKGGL